MTILHAKYVFKAVIKQGKKSGLFAVKIYNAAAATPAPQRAIVQKPTTWVVGFTTNLQSKNALSSFSTDEHQTAW